MSRKDVRRGNTQAEFNDNASTWLFGEIFIISFLAGGFTFNWIIGVSVFLIFSIMLWFRKSKIALLVALTITATSLGLYLGFMLGGIIGSLVLGIIFFLISAGIHRGAYEWTEDINYESKE